MRGKLLFITGGLVGYVLGARAGRKRYEQITASAKELWKAPPIQRRVTEVRDFALEAVGDVPAVLFEAGKKVFTSVQGKVQDKVQDTSAGPVPSESASAARTAAAANIAKGGDTTGATSRPAKSAARPAKPSAKPAKPSAKPTAKRPGPASESSEHTDK